MRWAMAGAAVLPAALLLAALSASAQVSGTDAIETEVTFRPLDAADFTLISGRVTMEGDALGAFVVTNATFRIEGLEQVCWDLDDLENGCAESPSRALSVIARGDTGFRLPDPVAVEASAAHLVGLFLDLSASEGLEDLRFAPSLVGPTLEADLRIGPVTPIPYQDPDTAFRDHVSEDAGGLVPINSASTVTVFNGSQRIAEVSDQERVGFTGLPVFGAIAPEGWVVPFVGMDAHFTRAGLADAREGLDVDRLEAFLGKVQDAAEGQAADLDGLRALLDAAALKEMLRGVLVRLPGDEAEGLGDLPLMASFVSLDAAGGERVSVTAEAALVLQDGHIEGAQTLAGVWLIQLPWWGWLLWGLALVAFALRIILKAPKRNERWDRFNWIGRVALIPVVLLVFWLWDMEWAHLIGTSAFTTGGSIWVLLLLQTLSLILVMGAVAWPLSILIRNGLMLARQGRFMNLGLPVAALVAFLLGATLVRAYLELLLQEMPVA